PYRQAKEHAKRSSLPFVQRNTRRLCGQRGHECETLENADAERGTEGGILRRMAGLAGEALAVGEAALAAGDWEAARSAFEAALEQRDEPAARDGLARALWWIEGPRAALAERSRAYAGYCRSGDTHAAAHVALWM